MLKWLGPAAAQRDIPVSKASRNGTGILPTYIWYSENLGYQKIYRNENRKWLFYDFFGNERDVTALVNYWVSLDDLMNHYNGSEDEVLPNVG